LTAGALVHVLDEQSRKELRRQVLYRNDCDRFMKRAGYRLFRARTGRFGQSIWVKINASTAEVEAAAAALSELITDQSRQMSAEQAAFLMGAAS
jgi:hypothetical protein